MRTRRFCGVRGCTLPVVAAATALAVAGCGGDGGESAPSSAPPSLESFAPPPEEITPPKDLAAGAQLTPQNPLVGARLSGAANVSVSIEPDEGGKIVVLPLVGNTSSASKKAQLSLRINIKNQGGASIHLNNVGLSFTGPPSVSSASIGASLDIGAGATSEWHFDTANNVILPLPTPGSVTVSLKFNGYSTATNVTKSLATHKSPVAGNAYLFPSKASDLRIGEYWSAKAAAHAPAGDGGQLFAYDMGVIAWTNGAWSSLLPGGSSSKNQDYRIWGKPIRAMAAGTVVAFADQYDTNPSPPADLSPPYPVEGNHFYLQHGDELVLYAHLQKGTLNSSLKQVGAQVQAGTFLGSAGNSGNSTAPHLHIHSIQATQPWQGPTRPLPFRETYAIDQTALNPPDPAGAWTKLSVEGPPVASAAVWPAGTAPTWYPPGYGEISKHGIPASSYQTEFDKIYKSGYRPVWVDGFQVAGKTYFNVIFRPADGVGWQARHGLTSDQYQAEFDAEKAKGWRPLHIESYPDGGSIRYASIFVSSSGPAWNAYHGRNDSEHQTLFNQLTGQGWRPVIVSVTSIGGQRRYAALYEKKDVGSYWTKSIMSSSQYQTEFNNNAGAGRKLVYLNAYTDSGQVRYTAVWHSKPTNWPYARHGLTSSQYQAEFDAQLGKGLLTRAVTGVEAGGQAYYAAIWSK